MRAAVIHQVGGTLGVEELPDPVPADGEVLVDITHASVNPLDIWVCGGVPGVAAQNLPWIPGTEGAGLHNGLPVLVRGGGIGVLRRGLYTTRAAVPTTCLVELPVGTDPVSAAAIGVAGITAWHCVHTRGACTANDRVLVLGASGGVGSMAVQIAKATGATVWGQTTSASKATGVTALGADRVVVTEADGLEAAVAELKPTLVVDGLGGTFTTAAVAALENFGRLVLYGASASDDIPLSSRGFYRKGLTLLGYTGLLDSPSASAKVLTDLLENVRAGTLRVPTEVLPLSAAADAHARILGRKVEGKLVLDTRA
jgi:NADPH2:quinone reductase